MNKVTVKSGGNIQGSLISDNVTINEKCDMKDCIVGTGKRVEAEGNYYPTIYINEGFNSCLITNNFIVYFYFR